MHQYLWAVPEPDPTITMSSAASDGLTMYAIAISAVITLIALYKLVRDRSPLMASCLVGGLLCVAIEPIWDVVGHLHFTDGNHVAFTMFAQLDHPVHYPWWAVLVYVQFSGISAYLFYRLFLSDHRRRLFWMFITGQFVMNIVVEMIYIRLKAYEYYGDTQPLRVLGYPIWWIFADIGELLAGAALCYLVPRYGLLRGQVLAPIIVVPSAFGAWELWTGWPVYATLNMDVGLLWTTAAAALTAAICMAGIWFLYDLLCRPKVATPGLPATPQTVILASSDTSSLREGRGSVGKSQPR